MNFEEQSFTHTNQSSWPQVRGCECASTGKIKYMWAWVTKCICFQWASVCAVAPPMCLTWIFTGTDLMWACLCVNAKLDVITVKLPNQPTHCLLNPNDPVTHFKHPWLCLVKVTRLVTRCFVASWRLCSPERTVQGAGHEVNQGIRQIHRWEPQKTGCYLTAVCQDQSGWVLLTPSPTEMHCLPTEPTLMYQGEVWLNQYLSKKNASQPEWQPGWRANLLFFHFRNPAGEEDTCPLTTLVMEHFSGRRCDWNRLFLPLLDTKKTDWSCHGGLSG